MDLRLELLGTTALSLAKPLGMRLEERVSSTFALDVGLLMPVDPDFDPSSFLGQPFGVAIVAGPGEVEQRWGIISQLTVLGVVAGEAVLELSCTPRLERLAETRHSRVFVGRSVPEIVAEVLALEGLPSDAYRFELSSHYEPREHVCQYREPSLAFVARLLEKEGIHYAFEHGDEGDVVVFRDLPSGPEAPGPYRFRQGLATLGLVVGEPTVVALRARSTTTAGEVNVSDRSAYGPSRDVRERCPVSGGAHPRVVKWAANEETSASARRRAVLLGEALRSRRDVFEGRSSSPALRAGGRFSLVEHPRADLDGTYFLTSVDYELVATSSLELRELLRYAQGNEHFSQTRFEAVSAEVAYRPPLSTPVPRVDGLVDAVVDGPVASAYAQIDEHGRYRVRARFDELSSPDGGSSLWVRMLQPHGGSTEGMHFPLRKGTEVHLAFLGGDPDRPVIAGVSSNAVQPSPVTRRNASQNVVQTGGNNRLEIDDVRGAQRLAMSTPTAASHLQMGAGPYQLALRTTGQGRFFTGSSLEVEVLGALTENVTSHVAETYGATHVLEVFGRFTETLKSTLDTTVTGPVASTISGPLTESITGAVSETYASSLSTSVTGGLTKLHYDSSVTHHVTAAATVAFAASQDTQIDGALSHTVSGSVVETLGPTKRHVRGTYDVTVDALYELHAPNTVVEVPQVGFNFATLLRLSPFQLEVEGLSNDAQGIDLSFGGSKTSITRVSASATGASLSLSGVSMSTDSGTWFERVGFERKLQALRATVSVVELELGPKVIT